MDITRFLTVVEELATNGGACSFDEALVELGECVERLDTDDRDYEKNVTVLMRVAASIWKQQRTAG